jgi:hypothetical protein
MALARGYIYKPIGVKSNTIQLLYSDEAARPSSDPAAGCWSGWHRNKFIWPDGTAIITGTVHQRYLLGVCSDPHMIFCACSMQNGPHEPKVDHTSFYVINKLFTQTPLIGRGDVTFLHIAYVKSTKNVGKLTCIFGRFKNPFFLWLIRLSWL